MSDVPGYESSIEMMSPHIFTVHRLLLVHHWVTVALLTPLFCVMEVGETFSDRWMQPLLFVSSWRFGENLMLPFCWIRVCLASLLEVIDYSRDRM